MTVRAVVTGAGSGIGRATALRFAADGARLALIGRRASPLEETAELARAGGAAEVVVLPADLAVEDQVAAAFATISEQFGGLDVAVNAAGGGSGIGPLHTLTESTFDEVVAINLKSTWLSMKYELTMMLPAGSGSIVNLSSLQGMRGVPGAAAYSAAKHGIIGLTKTAALEAGPSGVRVNVVSPGPVRTGQLASILRERMPDLTLGEAEDRLASTYPLRRIVESREVADLIAWLSSDAAVGMSGTVIPIDGGMSAG